MEYIKSIEIKNFKSIRHQVIDGCKRINVFIGYPNVGKSNILEALGLYSSLQIDKENFRFNDICRVRHFSELFFNKDYKEVANVALNNAISLDIKILSGNVLKLNIENLKDTSGQIVHRNALSSTIDSQNFHYKYQVKAAPNDYHYIVGDIKKYSFLNGNAIHLQRSTLSLNFPFGDNLLDVLQREPDLRKEIASLFDEYGLKLFIDGEEIKFLKYLNDGTGVSIPYHQIADTLRMLIFYKAAILSNKETVLLFEEPEAHMFPPYIRKFTTDVIYDRTNQFFMASHSPYVLDAFLEDAPNDLAIYLVYYENGETKVKLMQQKDIDEVREYGVDLFFNLESYLKHGQINNA